MCRPCWWEITLALTTQSGMCLQLASCSTLHSLKASVLNPILTTNFPFPLPGCARGPPVPLPAYNAAAMATPSREYIVRGLKISLDILQDISSDLPIPASSIVNLVERIIDIIEVRSSSHRFIDSHTDALYCRKRKRTEKSVRFSGIAFSSFCLLLS